MDEFRNFDEVWQRVTGRRDAEESRPPEKQDTGERICLVKPPVKSAAVRFLPDF